MTSGERASSVVIPSSVDVLKDQSDDADNVTSIRTDRRSNDQRICRSPHLGNPCNDVPASDSRGNKGSDSASGAELIQPQTSLAGQVRASDADKMSAVYSFILNLNIKQIRTLLREWRCKQTGNKGALVARAFMNLQIIVLSGKSLSQVMRTNSITQRFDSWMEQRITLDNRSPLYLTQAPTDSAIIKELEAKEAENFKKQRLNLQKSTHEQSHVQTESLQRTENTELETEHIPRATEEDVAPVTASNIFSISEFARLCIIMRDDEDAKAALLGTGQELTRSQLDAGFTRESYWGIIEDRFNDPSLKLNLNMVGMVDEVDSTKPPPCHRSASFLKEKFFDAKRSFTTCLENWSVSGQNDNADFKRFAGTRNGDLTAEGKRNMVLFVCARKGTDNEDTRFLNFCTRVIPFGRGCDEGSLETATASQRTGVNGNRRRNRESEGESRFEKAWLEYSEVATAEKRAKVEDRNRRNQSRERNEAQESRKKELARRQWAVLSMGRLYGTMKSQGLNPDQTFERCARIQMKDLQNVFMMPQQEGEGLLPEMSQSGFASITEPRTEGVEQLCSEAVQPPQSNINGEGFEENEIQPDP